MSLAKLKAAPMRRGRGNLTEEARQAHDESVKRDELLRCAIIELCEGQEALVAELASEVARLEARIDFLEDLH